MSEDRKEAVDAVVERIHYLLLTNPDNLELNSKEKSLLHHLHENFDGSWNRFVASIEAQKELNPDKSHRYDLTMAHIGWLRAYESRNDVSLIEMYLAGATRTI
jgi:hypothetical protein